MIRYTPPEAIGAGTSSPITILEEGQFTGPDTSIVDIVGGDVVDVPQLDKKVLRIPPNSETTTNTELKELIGANGLKPGTLYVVLRGSGTDVAMTAISADTFEPSADQINIDGTATAGTYDVQNDLFTVGGVGGIGQQGPPGLDGIGVQWIDIDYNSFLTLRQNGQIDKNAFYAVQVASNGIEFRVLIHAINTSGQFQPAIRWDNSDHYSFGIYDVDNFTFTPQGGNGGAGPDTRGLVFLIYDVEFLANTYPQGFTNGWCRLSTSTGQNYVYYYDDGNSQWFAFDISSKQTGFLQSGSPITFTPHTWVNDVTLSQTGVGAQLLQLATTTDAQGNSTKAFSVKALKSSGPGFTVRGNPLDITLGFNPYIAGSLSPANTILNPTAGDVLFPIALDAAAGTEFPLFWQPGFDQGNSFPEALQLLYISGATTLNGNDNWLDWGLGSPVIQLICRTTATGNTAQQLQFTSAPLRVTKIAAKAHLFFDLGGNVTTWLHATTGANITAREGYVSMNQGANDITRYYLKIIQPGNIAGARVAAVIRGHF